MSKKHPYLALVARRMAVQTFNRLFDELTGEQKRHAETVAFPIFKERMSAMAKARRPASRNGHLAAA